MLFNLCSHIFTGKFLEVTLVCENFIVVIPVVICFVKVDPAAWFVMKLWSVEVSYSSVAEHVGVA
jgi:hypothetical protein